jgi:hypothetical protein
MGGRRCEIVGLKSRSELNGKMGIVGHYFGKKDRYAVVVDDTKRSKSRYAASTCLEEIERLRIARRTSISSSANALISW